MTRTPQESDLGMDILCCIMAWVHKQSGRGFFKKDELLICKQIDSLVASVLDGLDIREDDWEKNRTDEPGWKFKSDSARMSK